MESWVAWGPRCSDATLITANGQRRGQNGAEATPKETPSARERKDFGASVPKCIKGEHILAQ
jgi:hypothetical protein